jgi:hypothetical protein
MTLLYIFFIVILLILLSINLFEEQFKNLHTEDCLVLPDVYFAFGPEW